MHDNQLQPNRTGVCFYVVWCSTSLWQKGAKSAGFRYSEAAIICLKELLASYVFYTKFDDRSPSAIAEPYLCVCLQEIRDHTCSVMRTCSVSLAISRRFSYP